MDLHHGIKAGLKQSSYLRALGRKYKDILSCLISVMSHKTQLIPQFSIETEHNKINFTCVIFIIIFCFEIIVHIVSNDLRQMF